MISIYEEVLEGTTPESQERFDKFREFYENHPKTSPYCEILESSKQLLKVVFHRCPHVEILKNEDLFEFAESSCLSDIAFTERLLPGVKFTRESSIREGSEGCIMKWEKLN
jgi:L-2-amino-thiazoline-4-carboxylic acid hydrolase-like protein